MPQFTEEERQRLEDPAISLPRFGKVMDLHTQRVVPFDVNGVSKKMTRNIIAYVSDPPRDREGYTKWPLICSGRQSTKSTSVEYALYPKAAFNFNWDHVCIADVDDRASYLFSRVQLLHQTWDAEAKSADVNRREVNQLSFLPIDKGGYGGRMRTMTARSAGGGVGMSPNSCHLSELGFMPNLDTLLGLLVPSMSRQLNSMLIGECTPTPLGPEAPSSDAWKELFLANLGSASGLSRWVSLFYPFWDSVLNERDWQKDWQMTLEEQRLMDRYARFGLTERNLAFRRHEMATIKQFIRNPELFACYYPFDPITCWVGASSKSFPNSAIAAQTDTATTPLEGTYQVFRPYNPNAVYCILVDPVGWGVRDHGSFHVFECWEDAWEQAALYSSNGDPTVLEAAVEVAYAEYGGVKGGSGPVIFCERNGVGEGFTAMLLKANLPCYWDSAKDTPGIWLSDGVKDNLLTDAIVALIHKKIILRCSTTLVQCATYNNDKKKESSVRTELLNDGVIGRRREKHHWDQVSALLLYGVAIKNMPVRYRIKAKSRSEEPEEYRSWDSVPHKEQQRLLKAAQPKEKPARRTSFRRRKK